MSPPFPIPKSKAGKIVLYTGLVLFWAVAVVAIVLD